MTLDSVSVALLGSLLASWTVTVDCAGAARVTGNETRLPGAIVIGPGRIMSIDEVWTSALAVIVTVAGALLANPSFTINCTTYVPSTSATNAGCLVLADSSVALLPCGRLVNDHE